MPSHNTIKSIFMRIFFYFCFFKYVLIKALCLKLQYPIKPSLSVSFSLSLYEKLSILRAIRKPRMVVPVPAQNC